MGYVNKVNTDHFSDVELYAKKIAEDVRDLKGQLSTCKLVATAQWVGKGRASFDDLYVAVDWQMKDISDEFWNIYEALIDAEVAYMDADQAIATEIETAHSEMSGSLPAVDDSDSSGGGSGGGSGAGGGSSSDGSSSETGSSSVSSGSGGSGYSGGGGFSAAGGGGSAASGGGGGSASAQNYSYVDLEGDYSGGAVDTGGIRGGSDESYVIDDVYMPGEVEVDTDTSGIAVGDTEVDKVAPDMSEEVVTDTSQIGVGDTEVDKVAPDMSGEVVTDTSQIKVEDTEVDKTAPEVDGDVVIDVNTQPVDEVDPNVEQQDVNVAPDYEVRVPEVDTVPPRPFEPGFVPPHIPGSYVPGRMPNPNMPGSFPDLTPGFPSGFFPNPAPGPFPGPTPGTVPGSHAPWSPFGPNPFTPSPYDPPRHDDDGSHPLPTGYVPMPTFSIPVLDGAAFGAKPEDVSGRAIPDLEIGNMVNRGMGQVDGSAADGSRSIPEVDVTMDSAVSVSAAQSATDAELTGEQARETGEATLSAAGETEAIDEH